LISEQLIADYVRELRVSAWIVQLTAEQTAELENEVRERIARELDAAGSRDEETVYRVFDELGAPGDMVARWRGDAPSTRVRAIETASDPVTSFRSLLQRHGWGLAEIAALILLMAGPFLIWWIGPIFGIILVRAATNRWSDRSMRVATAVVAVLFSVQALFSLGLFVAVVVGGGSAAIELQRIVAMLGTGAGPLGFFPPTGASAALLSRSPLEIILVLLAPIAGLSAGIYLAMSPRYRRKRSRCLRTSAGDGAG
jgi:hypothetical protein